MKHGRWMAVALAADLAVPVVAGEKGKKCDMDAQACCEKMAAELKNRGWVGIEMDDEGGRPTVKRVVPGSHAESAGLRAGDVLVALNGTALGEKNKAEIKAAYKAMTPGAKASYTVQRGGQEREVEGTLGKLPQRTVSSRSSYRKRRRQRRKR